MAKTINIYIIICDAITHPYPNLICGLVKQLLKRRNEVSMFLPQLHYVSKWGPLGARHVLWNIPSITLPIMCVSNPLGVWQVR